MVINISVKKLKRFFLCLAAILIFCFVFLRPRVGDAHWAGGARQEPPQLSEIAQVAPVSTLPTEADSLALMERFRRPSQSLPYPNPYSFTQIEAESGGNPASIPAFSDPEALILAYYGMLQDASNMQGFSGGCGSIGWGLQPYPYAYELFTDAAKDSLPYQAFEDSFQGIGYLTLLKLLPAYTPPGTPDNLRYYMVELETIRGAALTPGDYQHLGGRFAYTYGLVTVEETPTQGFQIQQMDYIPEDFLCAPEHGWFYYADAVVAIVYQENLKLVSQIDKTEQQGDQISVYASGSGKQYRFDFVRLTNGYDILLHEYRMEGSQWVEVSLLTEDWSALKLAAEAVPESGF